MKISVVVFPGSNCDHDVEHVYRDLLGQEVKLIWHQEHDLGRPDLVVLPGGFAHGDYLRTGALAKLSPIMKEVLAHAARGGHVLGICNGFQILCEAGLLPGVLLPNIGTKFLSIFVNIKTESTDTFFTRGLSAGEIITCPIAHMEGNYFADEDTVAALNDQGRIVFRYCDAQGRVQAEDRHSNPNGSLGAIAGICNKTRNVVGLMPHPERAAELLVGGPGKACGLKPFQCSITPSVTPAA